ncbi:unnamed protein product, partial [Prorocentrum cordatum]
MAHRHHGTREAGPGVAWECIPCGRSVKSHLWRCLCGTTFDRNENMANQHPGGAHFEKVGGRIQPTRSQSRPRSEAPRGKDNSRAAKAIVQQAVPITRVNMLASIRASQHYQEPPMDMAELRKFKRRNYGRMLRGLAKSQEDQDAKIAVDNPEFAWLGNVLNLLRREAKGDYLFGFNYADWVQSFADVGRRLRLGYPPVLYQLRHGGASHEALAGFRDAAGLKQRGRWSSDASVRRCAKGGRVNQVLASLSAAMRRHGADCEARLGRFSHSWRRHPRLANVPIYEIDLRYHLSHDLTVRKGQRIIRGLIQHGLVRAIWLGVPCNTFSRARESGPPGPTPLRSAEFPAGLPNPKPHDQQKLEVGSALAAFAARLMAECRRRNVPVVFENPWTSRLFQQPCFL